MVNKSNIQELYFSIIKDFPIKKWKCNAEYIQGSFVLEVDFSLQSDAGQVFKTKLTIDHEKRKLAKMFCSYKYDSDLVHEELNFSVLGEICMDDRVINEILNYFKNSKLLKYIWNDFERYRKKNITEYIKELTRSGLVTWNDESLYGDDCGEIKYVTEYGDEKFIVEIYEKREYEQVNLLDDVLFLEDEVEGDLFNIYPQDTLTIQFYSNLCMVYEDVLDEELKRMITHSTNLNVISIDDVMIRTTNYSCTKRGHFMIRVKALVVVYNEDGVLEKEVEAAYCQECDAYFVLENDYNRLKKYGTIGCRILTLEEFVNPSSESFNWANQSIINAHGYNVNAKNNLSDTQRQQILSFIIENNIQHPHEIINFLLFLIEKNRYRKNMERAIIKWERDIEFVRSYQMINHTIRVRNIFIKEKRYK